MKKIILVLIAILIAFPAYAKRPQKEAQSQVDKALKTQEQALKNNRRSNRNAYEMLEQGRKLGDDAEYNKTQRKLEKNRKRNNMW